MTASPQSGTSLRRVATAPASFHPCTEGSGQGSQIKRRQKGTRVKEEVKLPSCVGGTFVFETRQPNRVESHQNQPLSLAWWEDPRLIKNCDLLAQNNSNLGNFPVSRWLELRAFASEGLGSIPGWGAKMPQVTQCSFKKRKFFKNIIYNSIKT